MIAISVRLVRRLQGLLPFLARHAASRSALLAQLSARPWREVVLRKLQSFAATRVFDDAVRELANGSLETGSERTPGRGDDRMGTAELFVAAAPSLLGTRRLSQFTARLVRELRPLSTTAPTPGGRLGGLARPDREQICCRADCLSCRLFVVPTVCRADCSVRRADWVISINCPGSCGACATERGVSAYGAPWPQFAGCVRG